MTSPTVLLEALLTTSVIDGYEEIELSIVDVPGHFLTADQDETINMKLRGKLSEIIVKTALEVYRKYVIIERGEWYYMYSC